MLFRSVPRKPPETHPPACLSTLSKSSGQLGDPLFTRIDRKILALADDPRPAGCKKLKGYKDQWRVRVGNWRVVYIVDDTAKLVSITRIAHRCEVYE